MRIAISIQTEYLDNPDQRFQRRKIYPTKIKSPRQLLVKRLKFEVNCRIIALSPRYGWSARLLTADPRVYHRQQGWYPPKPGEGWWPTRSGEPRCPERCGLDPTQRAPGGPGSLGSQKMH